MQGDVGLILLFSVVLAMSPLPALGKDVTLTVQRNFTCKNNETVGRLILNGKEVARTLELPWRNDEPNISRVRAGSYAATMRADGKLGWRIELHDVPSHSSIELHVGNFSHDTKGCILVGTEVTAMLDKATQKQGCAVQGSTNALTEIQNALQSVAGDGYMSHELNLTVVITD